MKKLGVCVRYITDNYGSMLQLLALQKAIEKNDWSYEFIVYDKNNLKFILSNLDRVFNPYFFKGKMLQLKKNANLKRYPEIAKLNAIRLKAFSDFRTRCFKFYSPVYRGYKNLSEGSENYDAILVGSDQLWGPEGLKTNFYNLMFVKKNIKKIAYSTSFGVSQIPKKLEKKYADFLNRIEFISVREISGQRIVKDVCGKDVPVVVDPVMLLSRTEWDILIPNECKEKKPYLLCYFLGSNPEHRRQAEIVKERFGWDIVTLPHIDEVVEADLRFGDEQLYDVSPESFLNLIRNAECVLTDSFHGTAFCIINNKKFVVFDRFSDNDKSSRNTRIDTICTLFGLNKCRYSGNIEDNLTINIDYESVNNILDGLRKDSLKFLADSLV